MVIRLVTLLSFAVLLGACYSPPPLRATPSFVTSPALMARNPADIAVLPLEDGTPTQAATPHLEFMRQVLVRSLPDRLYSPLAPQAVDAAMRSTRPRDGQSVLTPAYLEAAAGKASEEALLAVRVDEWDEGRLLADKIVTFQFQAALVANDGELLWSGTLSGQVKAGGSGPAPLGKDAMARSCAELALGELLAHLRRRSP